MNPEKTSLETRLIAAGIAFGGGIAAGVISLSTDNKIDSNSLSIMIPALTVGCVAGATYLAFCKENAKVKVDALKNHVMIYASLMGGYLGVYFIQKQLLALSNLYRFL